MLSLAASPPGAPVLNFSEDEPCRTCYVEVYTNCGSEHLGSVYNFRDWKPWKRILLSELKTLEVHTIIETENRVLFSELEIMGVYSI